ncbi:hypothetical protein [Streptomyces marincola]|uniref:Uncharacterized protein n=1 Tax=Streptomyces marincola TaxID=2878388 RepID=A0A1W7CTQ3_9ACTN|nr:hypothetical protein [Streptomyces marincola]ARQ67770.1 hypothetical protein CAG99_02030 [Streptomyces marincola]
MNRPRGNACRSAPGAIQSAARPAHLYLPVTTPDGLASDAVGVSEEHGRRIMASLPRAGAVFATGHRWWWVVPSESQIGLNWPDTARYWAGACLPAPAGREHAPTRARSAPQLIHWPEDAGPYTHPILLYIAVCRLAGVSPVTSVTPVPSGLGQG